MTIPSSQNPNLKSFIEPTVQPEINPLSLKPVPNRKLPGWRLWAPLLIQAMMIVAVPAQDAYTYVTGTPVTLQTAPVDPYDFLRGYYQTLSYDISRLETLKTLPGGNETFTDYSSPKPFYIVLEPPTTETSPPTPWQPIRVSKTRPQDLEANQIALKGQYTYRQVTYGLERYYMPEAQRTDINQHIRSTQRQNQAAFVVDIKVDSQGNAVAVGLWVDESNYQF